MLETLVDYNDCNNATLYNNKIQQAVSRVIEEIEEEERDAERNINSMIMDTSFNQSPISTNTQGEIASETSERRISSDNLAETINGFNEFTTQSTINDSEEDDAERYPNSNPKVATYTTKGNSPQ